MQQITAFQTAGFISIILSFSKFQHSHPVRHYAGIILKASIIKSQVQNQLSALMPFGG
jgi:hypothetical protein